MYGSFWFPSLLFALLFAVVNSKSSSGNSLLAVIEPEIQDDYSIFFNGLKESGYDVTFRNPKDEHPEILKDDIALFHHVIMFTDLKNLSKDLTPQNLVELTRKDTNLLLAVPSKQTPLTSLAAEFGLILPPPNTPLMSYFPERPEPPTLIPIQKPPPSNHSILSSVSEPIWFSGVGFALTNNPMVFPILGAPAESFAADSAGDSGADALVDAAEKGGEGLWAGSSLAVVAGFQTKKAARVTWVGGMEMFSNALIQKKTATGVSGNEQAARDIAAWTFREKNVYKIEKVTHNLVNATSSIPPDHYTTNDQVVFTAEITRFDPVSGKWVPYSGIMDMQLSFTMLDPHIRTSLRPVADSPGKYSVQFRVPDRHGVFKFVIDYKRKGFSHLFSSTTIPVVPPRHDGYPRFLSAAWPYYTGAISTSIAFFIFSAMWLAGDARDPKKKSQKVE